MEARLPCWHFFHNTRAAEILLDPLCGQNEDSIFIGDIVGSSGREIVAGRLADIVESRQIDPVIANGENSAAGSGITLGGLPSSCSRRASRF